MARYGSVQYGTVSARLSTRRSPPRALDDRVLGRGSHRGVEHADDFPRLLGRDGQRGLAVQVVGDVGVVRIPVSPDRGDGLFEDGRRIPVRRIRPRWPGDSSARSMSPARSASSWGSTPCLANPPAVPRTHHRGRSRRQRRLVSTWNRMPSNSRTIRPCPPLSTSGQGAGVIQAASRRHGPSPSWSA